MPPCSPRRAGLLPPEGISFLQNIQEGPKWARLLFRPHSLLNTPHFRVFGLISFRNIVKLYGLRNDTCFPSKTVRNFMDYAMMLLSPSEMLQNFTDYATTLVWTSRMLQNFTDYATMLALTSRVLRNFTDYATKLILTSRESTQSLQADRQCPRMKLGYDRGQ